MTTTIDLSSVEFADFVKEAIAISKMRDLRRVQIIHSCDKLYVTKLVTKQNTENGSDTKSES